MKDTFEESDLIELLTEVSSPSATLYMPTNVAGWERQEDTVRYDNLLMECERRFVGKGTGKVEARQLLRQARQLQADASYWEERDRGLALFLSPVLFRHYRLPVAFEELLYVDGRFWITPLLDVLRRRQTFCVLALSHKRLRLFHANTDSLTEERAINVPYNLQEILDYELVRHGSQVHSGRHDAKHKESAVFHGQGDESKARKAEVRNFYRVVDESLCPLLDTHRFPLLLAGVEPECALYREVSKCRQLVGTELHGSYDHLPPSKLHADVQEVIESAHAEEMERISAQLRDQLDGRHGSDHLGTVCLAASSGQVDMLMIRRHAHMWGTYVQGTTTVVAHDTRHPDDDELLDWVVSETLRHHGTVHLCDESTMPSGATVAARFRYDASMSSLPTGSTSTRSTGSHTTRKGRREGT